MAKQFDYYAGYPGQQKTPKWVGVVLGSLFGTMALIVVAIGVRLLVPARVAEASVAKPEAVAVAPSQPLVAEPAATADTPVAAVAQASDSTQEPPRAHKHHGKGGKRGKAARSAGGKLAKAAKLPKVPKLVETKQYKHAQVFAKSVSAGSHRDRKARADLDKMLGL